MESEPLSADISTSQWRGNYPGNITYTGGNVGVGQNIPSYTLDVGGDINYTGTFRLNGTPVSFAGSQWTSGSGYITYSGGNVGIGKIPSYSLDVAGDINYTGTIRLNGTPVSFGGGQWTSGTSNIYYVNGVGIGTSAVGSNLTVAGNVYISNTLTCANVVSSQLFVGNASALSNITASNLVGNVASSNGALVVTQAAQPNITSVGTLTSLTTSGTVTAPFFIGGGNVLSNINASNITQPFANLAVSNTVTTTNSNSINSNVSSNLSVSGALISNATNTTLFFDTLTIPYVNTLTMNSAAVTTQTLIATGVTSFANIIVSNLQVTNTFIITATNTQTTNSLSIVNQGTATALYVNQNEFPNMTYNVAEFWDHTQLAMVIDGYGNVAVHTASSPGYAFTVVDGAKIDKLTVTGSLIASGAALSSLNASNVTTGILSSARIYGNTLSNIQSSNVTQPFSNLAVSNSVTTANITATRGMGVGAYAGSAAPANSLIVSGNTGIGTNAPGYLLDVAGYMRSVAIVDHTSSIGSAGQVLTSTGSSLEWASVQPLANLVVSNTVTTSEIICNAFTTSTATNWNYISNAASARSTSVGWQGIRQVFGDHITSTVYVYNNAVLETTLSYIASGFGAFVAVGGINDAIIVVSGVDAFYIYYFDGLIWNGPNAVDTTRDIGVYNTLWMPSLSVGDTTSLKLVIGGYGWVSAAGGGNPCVGVYNIRLSDGHPSIVGKITPYSIGPIYRNTVAISGDGTTIAIGQQDSSILYVYSVGDFTTPVFSDSTDPGDEYFVSIDYYGQIVLLTLNSSVRMYSNSLTPV